MDSACLDAHQLCTYLVQGGCGHMMDRGWSPDESADSLLIDIGMDMEGAMDRAHVCGRSPSVALTSLWSPLRSALLGTPEGRERFARAARGIAAGLAEEYAGDLPLSRRQAEAMGLAAVRLKCRDARDPVHALVRGCVPAPDPVALRQARAAVLAAVRAGEAGEMEPRPCRLSLDELLEAVA